MVHQTQKAKTASQKQASILIVDDRPENLELLVQILKQDGHLPRPALNAQVAMGAVEHTRPDLILLDIRMPEMDGFELCRKFKSDPATQDIPIIFISALEDIDEKIKAFKAGGIDYITRPFQEEEVLARVSTHLELSNMRHQMESLVQDRTQTLQEKTRQLAKEVEIRQDLIQKLKESEENYRFLVDNQNDLVVRFDAEHCLLFSNPNYCRIFGISADEVSGKSFTSFIHEDDRDTVEQSLRALTKAPHTCRHQERALTVDGWRRFEWSASASMNERGEIRSIISVGRDITEKTEMEEKLRQAHKMEAIGTLSGGIAHDFNNMLSIIIGNTELAMDELPEGHTVQANLDEIRIATLRARDVVRQLVNLSHATDLQRYPVDLCAQTKNVLKLIRASLPSTIEIIETIPSDAQMVMADANQMQQLLINLSTNAFQSMDSQGGVLTVAIDPLELVGTNADPHPDLAPGAYVVLSISDTGRGIAPDITEKIFDPYFTTREVGKGSGLGLAVVHNIVHSHGGAIMLESRVGKGSTFHIYLPRTEQAEETAVSRDDDIIPTGDERILYIDDEYAITKSAQSMLGRLGYDVTTLTDPHKALRLFKSDPTRYDLVITDMTMPKMTGDLLSEAILKIRGDTPIIICTGHSDLLVPQRAREIGIRHYANKPLAKNEIAHLIRSAIDHQTA